MFSFSFQDSGRPLLEEIASRLEPRKKVQLVSGFWAFIVLNPRKRRPVKKLEYNFIR
jgi:hypothetical protein